MSQDAGKTLFGFPVIVTDAVTPGTAVVGPMPTWEEVLMHGSVAKAIEAKAREYGIIRGLDGAIPNAEEISE